MRALNIKIKSFDSFNKPFTLFLLFVFLVASHHQAFATITFISASGASNVVTSTTGTGTSTATTTKIFGGRGDDDTSCQTDEDGTNDETCDSCALLTTFSSSCNEKSIYPNLKLRITFKTDKSDVALSTAKIVMRVGEDASSADVTLNSSTVLSGDTISANNEIFVEALWSNICAKADGTSSACDTSFSETTFIVGIDKEGDGTLDDKITMELHYKKVDTSERNHTDGSGGTCQDTNEGVCHFAVFKGDEKVYLDDLIIPTNFPRTDSTSSINFNKLRLYYDDTGAGFASIGPLSAYGELDINSDGELDRAFVSGLTNDVEHRFLLANVDEANNIYRVSSTTYLNDTYHFAIPEEVVGVLDEQKCFIATAAFGSPFEPKVKDLRKFRNQFLLTNSWGRKFVKWYYKLSPPLAKLIAQNETAKQVTRAALWPAWMVSYASLQFGVWGLFLSLLFIVTLGVGCVRILKRILK